MEVLVWKSYGETQVLLIKEGFTKTLKNEVLNCVSGLYDKNIVDKLETHTTLQEIYEWVQDHTDDDENFDQFEIVELKEL